MRSPDHALSNGVLQIRQGRILASTPRSASGFLIVLLSMGRVGTKTCEACGQSVHHVIYVGLEVVFRKLGMTASACSEWRMDVANY